MDRTDSLRLPIAGQVFIAADGDGHIFETVVACFDVEVLSGGKPILGDAQSGGPIPQNREAASVLIRERTKQQGVYDAEDCGVRPNSNRQRQQGDDGKAAGFSKSPDCISKVLN